MADFPAMTLWTDAYLGDTLHLTTIEHGAYLLLLMAMWRNGGVLPNDDAMLAKICKMRIDAWQKHRATLMAFFTVDGKWITQQRLAKEIKRRTNFSAVQSRKAKRRWLKTNEPPQAGASARHPSGISPSMLPLSKISSLTSNESVAEKKEGQREEAPAPVLTNGASPSTPENPYGASDALLNSRLMQKARAR